MEKRKITIAVLLITTLWVDQCFATFTYFSTHPYANQLPTQEVGPNGTVRNCYGRSLWTLIEYQSSLYAGYGDWQCNNSTPIHICSLTPPSTTHVCELVFHNDAVETFRIYNNKLFAVGIDPSPETGAWGNYAVKQNGVWSEITYFLVNNTIRPSHNFDIVEYSGAIWLLGNQWNTDGTSTQHATAWKSINNGALDSWTIGKS